MHEASELAGRYFDAWQAHDEQALSQILAEDVSFPWTAGRCDRENRSSTCQADRPLAADKICSRKDVAVSGVPSKLADHV